MSSQLEKVYFELAFTELAMDYYCLNERDREIDGRKDENNKAGTYRKRLEELINACFTEYESITGIGEKAEALRVELKNEVEALVKKIDRLELDKYVDIREEVPGEKFDYPDDDEAAKAVLRSIFSVNDNAVINERIKTAVYELPVRMTKVRFFDILKNSLKLYIGSGMDVLERAEYMLDSTSGIAGDKELLSDAGSAETASCSKDIDKLQEEYDYLNDLAGICNYICVLGRCSDEVRSSEKENVESLLRLIKASSSLDEESNIKEAELILTKLEGKLEELSQRKVTLEAKLEGRIESENTPDEESVRLENMRRLMSTSVYAELEYTDVREINANDVDEVYERMYEKLSEAFKNGDRALNRARQAAVLSALPVFFNSRTEVMNYVRESLASCGNAHEKNIAISKILEA